MRAQAFNCIEAGRLDCEATDLFGFHDIPLPAVGQQASIPEADAEQIGLHDSSVEPHLYLVTSDESAPNLGQKPTIQLHFGFTTHSPENVISILRARSAPYLDFSVYDLFRDDHDARPAAFGLEVAGVYLVGQLVQLSDDDVRILSCVTEASLDALRARLASLGLAFGMSLPGWNRDARLPIAL